ncbi:MAG: hypothetical protein QGG40_22550, partial [Myxococcota bacterium]|nr:hypothetical protein [Myxococcota bacterium]
MLLWLVLACASEPDPVNFESCPDVDCRKAWVLENWSERPDEVVDSLTALPDPIERIALATILTETFPGQVGALCERLPEGPSRTYCKKANGRPHLHQEPVKNPVTEGGVWDRGPFALSARPPVPAATFGGVEALEVQCIAGTPASVCHFEKAKVAARQGEPSRAAGICNALQSDQWRYECYFQASESAAPKGDPDQVLPEGV